MAPELVDVAAGAVARCVAGTGVESVALDSDPPECGCASLPVGADAPGDEGDEEFGAEELDAAADRGAPTTSSPTGAPGEDPEEGPEEGSEEGSEAGLTVLFGAAPPPVDAVGGAEVSTAGPVGESGCPLVFDAVRGVTELPALPPV